MPTQPKKTALYLAGPLFSLAEQMFNRALAIELRQIGYEVFVPQEFCTNETTAKDIAERCKSFLLKSDAVIVNLDGADTDSGTAFEAGMANEQKTTIGFRTDIRKSGDDSESGANSMFRLLDSVIHYDGNEISELANHIDGTIICAK